MPQQRGDIVVSAVVSRDVRAELERRAAAADRSLSGEVRRALRAYLQREGDEEENE
jgi:plasmid stability protein